MRSHQTCLYCTSTLRIKISTGWTATITELIIAKTGGMILDWHFYMVFFPQWCKSKIQTVIMMFGLTLRIQNRNQVRTLADPWLSTFRHNRTKAFITLWPLHWRELHSSFNKHLCSLVGLGYKREAMSALNFSLNTIDKNQTLFFISLADAILFWGVAVKFIKEKET